MSALGPDEDTLLGPDEGTAPREPRPVHDGPSDSGDGGGFRDRGRGDRGGRPPRRH